MDSSEYMGSSQEESGYLLFWRKNGDETQYPITQEVTTIGAALDADVRLKIEDIRIKDTHCVLSVNENGIATIINQSDENPVKVNDIIVKQKKVLKNGDTLQVVEKKFQYFTKKDAYSAHKKSLSPSKKGIKKSPNLKTKSATPRRPHSSKFVVSKAKSTNVHGNISKMVVNPATPQPTKLSLRRSSSKSVNVCRVSPRKSILKNTPAKKSNQQMEIARTVSFSKSKQSLTRKSRNKISSDELEHLYLSPRSSYSPLERSSTGEINTEDEDMFLNETQDISKTSLSMKNSNVAKTSPDSRKSTQKNKSLAMEDSSSPGSRKSLKNKSDVNSVTSSTKKNTDTNQYSNTKSQIGDLSVNLSPYKIPSARNSIQNKFNVISPPAQKSFKFNKSIAKEAAASFEFSGLEEDVFGSISSAKKNLQNKSQIQTPGSRRSVKSNQSLVANLNSSDEDDDDISSRNSVHNKSKIDTPGSRRYTKTNQSLLEILNIYDVENSVSPAKLSSRKSVQNKSQINTPNSVRSVKNDKSITDQTNNFNIENDNTSPTRLSLSRTSVQNKSYIQTPDSRKSVQINQSLAGVLEVEDSISPTKTKVFSDFEVEDDNVSPTRLYLTRNSIQDQSQIQTPGSRRSVKSKQSVADDLNNSEAEYNVSPTRLSSSSSRSVQNKSQLRTPGSRRSVKTNELLTENRNNFEFKDDNVSPTRVSSARKGVQNKSQIQTPAFRSIKTNDSLSNVLFDSEVEDISPSNNSEIEEDDIVSSTRVSSIRNSVKNKSQLQTPDSRRSLKSNELITDTPSNFGIEDGNVSPTKLSLARKSVQNKSHVYTPGSRSVKSNESTEQIQTPASERSIKTNESLANVFYDSEVKDISPALLSSSKSQNKSQVYDLGSRRSVKSNESLTKKSNNSEIEDDALSPTRATSARKGVQNKSQIQTPASRRLVHTPASRRSVPVSRISVKSNESLANTLDGSEVEDTSAILSSPRRSVQNKSQVYASGSRRSVKSDESLTKESNNSDIEDATVSPTRSSLTRKSVQNKSQIQTPGSKRLLKINVSITDKSRNFDNEDSVSPTKLSSDRKNVKNKSHVYTPGSKRSIKTNESLTDELTNFEIDNTVSPTRSSSRRSIRNESQLYSTSSTRSLKINQSITEDLNQFLTEDLNHSEFEQNLSLTKVSSARKGGQIKSHLGISKTRRSQVEDRESSENESPTRIALVRSSSRQDISQVDTNSSRRSSVEFSEYAAEDLESSNLKENDLRVKLNSSRKSRRTEDSELTVTIESLDYSDRDDTPKSLLSRKSNQNKSLNVTPSEELTIRLSDLSGINYASLSRKNKSTPGNRRSVSMSLGNDISPLKRLSVTDISSVKLDHAYFRHSIPMSDSIPSLEDSKLEDGGSSILANDQTRRSSRTRKSTHEQDFDYSLNRTNKSVCGTSRRDQNSLIGDGTGDSTVPLNRTKMYFLSDEADSSSENLIQDIRSRSSNGRNDSVISISSEDDSSENGIADTLKLRRTYRRSSTDDSSFVVTTPRNPEGRRRYSVPYQPITEAITPATPPTGTRNDVGFKTPLNSTELFESLRKSVLKSRNRLQRSAGNQTSEGNGVTIEKATKRRRESSSSSARSNKRVKLTTNEDYSFEQSFAFGSFNSEDILEPIDTKEEDTSQHMIDLATKPVIVYPSTRFSAEPTRKKSEPVRRSLQVTIRPTLRTAEVSKVKLTPKPKSKTTTSQKELKNDLSDVEGVKKLLKTPKVPKSPKNDLSNIPGVKHLFATPKEVKSPKNDLSTVPNLRRIMSPKQQNTPKNDLSDVRGLKKLLKTPKETKGPLNDLSDVRGLKKLMRTPRAQKQPVNDLSDVEGVADIFNTSVHHRLSNASDIENNEDIFNKIFDRRPLKTYRSKSTSPEKKLDAYGTARKTIGDKPIISPRVAVWLDEQAILNQKIAENLQDIKKPKKRTRVQEIKSDILPKKTRSGRSRRNVQEPDIQEPEADIQNPTVSSTKRNILGSVNEEVEATEITEKPASKLKKGRTLSETSVISETRTTRRNKFVKEAHTEADTVESIEAPKATRQRTGKKAADNSVKDIKQHEEAAVDTVKTRTRGRKKAKDSEEKVEIIILDSPKPTRGRKQAIKKAEDIENSVVEEIFVNSPVVSTRGRKNATKPIEGTEKVVEPPKVKSRGRNRPAKEAETVEETVADSSIKIAKDSEEKVELLVVDSPKPTRGRKKAIKKVNDSENLVVDSPKRVIRGKTKSDKGVEKVEEIFVNSPVVSSRGRRNATRQIERTENVVDSPKVKSRGRNRAAKDTGTVEETVVDSPQIIAKGKRNAAKTTEPEETKVDSTKAPSRSRKAAVKYNESSTETEIVTVPKGRTIAETSIKEPTDSPKITTVRGRKRPAKELVSEETKSGIADSPRNTRKRQVKRYFQSESEESPTFDGHSKENKKSKQKSAKGKKNIEVEEQTNESPKKLTKREKEALENTEAKKPARGKRKPTERDPELEKPSGEDAKRTTREVKPLSKRGKGGVKVVVEESDVEEPVQTPTTRTRRQRKVRFED